MPGCPSPENSLQPRWLPFFPIKRNHWRSAYRVAPVHKKRETCIAGQYYTLPDAGSNRYKSHGSRSLLLTLSYRSLATDALNDVYVLIASNLPDMASLVVC